MNIVEKTYYDNIEKIKKSNLKLVDNSTWMYRLNNCKKCEYYQEFTENQNMYKCRKCGCAGYKFLIESFKCPLIKPKWK